MEAISHTEEVENEENYEFKWGKKGRIGKNREVQFYESFTFDGEKYSLYDCVYLQAEDAPEPYIGKLVKIWEKPNHGRKIKVLWFFRPIEILYWLKDDLAQKNEIFLACGTGLGLTNVNPLEAIVDKCYVICTSKDKRNPQPSDAELKRADYIFYRTFDVGNLSIADKIDDRTAAIDVKNIFNRERVAAETGSIGSSAMFTVKLRPDITPPLTLGKDKSGSGLKVGAEIVDGKSFVSFVSPQSMSDDKAKAKPFQYSAGHGKGQFKKEPSHVMLHKAAAVSAGEGIKTNDQIMEVTRRPDADRRKWFKDLPLEDRIQSARDRQMLILLDNLDPSYTSSEVEDVIWHSFKEKCTAKVIPRTESSSPYSGQAIVIFTSRETAEKALYQLEKRCLMLPNGRVIIGRRPPRVLEGPAKFFGHLTIDKFKMKMRGEKETAVSTAHFAQGNTIEYEMAMEWRLLQTRSEVTWSELYKWHGEELNRLRKSLTKQPVTAD